MCLNKCVYICPELYIVDNVLDNIKIMSFWLIVIKLNEALGDIKYELGYKFLGSNFYFIFT